jgi:acetyl-CoA carboxylase biotin carboxyl carrier protein
LLTFDQIKELVELVSQRGLGGLEIERSGFRLRIEGQAAAPAAAPAPAAAGAPLLEANTPPPSGPAAAPAPPETSLPPGTHILNSPIVGTFYRAPAPGAPPFVEVGSRVGKGQVLCIIEAMKLMNEIESDADGTILEIYPQNAQAVEFGEPLFAIRLA